MILTNELKVAFKQMDCYTKSYRGLKFKKADVRDEDRFYYEERG